MDTKETETFETFPHFDRICARAQQLLGRAVFREMEWSERAGWRAEDRGASPPPAMRARAHAAGRPPSNYVEFGFDETRTGGGGALSLARERIRRGNEQCYERKTPKKPRANRLLGLLELLSRYSIEE